MQRDLTEAWGSARGVRPRDWTWLIMAVALGAVMLVLSLIATPAGAVVVTIGGHTYGVTPIKGVSAESLGASHPLAGPLATLPSGPRNFDGLPLGGGELLNHGGPVMHSVTTNVIYWDPNPAKFTATTKEIFNKFFTDVAHDKGLPTNVFAIGGQYKDATGHAAYSSSVGTEATDSTAYPASGCTPPTGVDEGPYTTCITDAQLKTELVAYIGAHPGLQTGPSQQFFVVLPHNVVTCLPVENGFHPCSNNAYCAYHSSINGGSENEIIYADIPFSLLDSGHAKDCQDDGNGEVQHPNGDIAGTNETTRYADVALKYTSHEYVEAATDPLGTAYFDAHGLEIGDKCNGVSPDNANDGIGYDSKSFLPPLGGSAVAGTLVNQSINSGSYYLQSEWDNAGKACLMQPLALSAASFTPTKGIVGSHVNFIGKATDPYNEVTFAWTFGDEAGTKGWGSPTFTYDAPGTYMVTMTATDGLTGSTTTPVKQPLVVKFAQTIAFTTTRASGAVGGPTYTVAATASSGLAVSFSSGTPSVCSVSGSTVSFIAVGTCTIDANQAGNTDFESAPQVQQSVPVGVGSQTITFTSTAPGSATVGGPTYAVTATASSGLAVSFSSETPLVCSVSGSTVSFIAVGTCILDANQGGNANYNAAPQVQQSFAVGKGSQTITITSTVPGAAAVGGPTYMVAATASSGLAVSFSSETPSVCTLSGSTVSFVGVGTCKIDANQGGSANYTAAPQVQQSFAVKNGQSIGFTSAPPGSATVGGPTYTVTATASSGLAVSFSSETPSVCTLSGSTVSFVAVGTCILDANQGGNASYNAAPQMQQSFTVGKGSQAITFTSTAPGSATAGGPTYAVTATASSGLAVSFSSGTPLVCSVTGSTVSFVAVGTCILDANQGGNASYNAAPQMQQSFAVGKGSQTITFTSTAPGSATVGGPTYAVTATASSGLAVSFSSETPLVCSVSGSTVSFIAVGTCILDANQGGNANYNAAPQVQQSFAVGKGSQTITFTSTVPGAAAVGGPTYMVAATASSGLAVSFSSETPSVCTLSGSTVSFIGVGTCKIDANQGGSANYTAAPQVQQSFAVKNGQSIGFTSAPPGSATVGGPTYTVTATASSGLAVAFSSETPSVCTLSGSTVSFVAVGTCILDANQGGNASYNAAPQMQQSFAVGKGSQTITFTSTAPGAAMVGGPTYTVAATASSGLAVSFSSGTPLVCSVTGSTVSFVAVGTCTLDANQGGNASYNAAPQMQQSFAVGKGSQTIAFTSTAPGAATVGGPTYAVGGHGLLGARSVLLFGRRRWCARSRAPR